MRYLSKLFILLCCFSTAALAMPSVGIILPLQHQAMTEIVNGFKTTLAKSYPHPVNVIVKNAQHDPGILQSIINQFRAQNLSVVAPVGTDTFEMTVAKIKQTPIVGVAALFDQQQQQKIAPQAVTSLLDEVSIERQFQFIKAAEPDLKKLSLVYSADAKVIDEVNQVKAAGKKYHIAIQPLMVQQVSDLYTLSQQIASDSQGIFILKDSLVVSGIATLAQQANKRHITLISSDDGSVKNGANYALGVSEFQIGAESAELVSRVLNGESAANIPVKVMTHLHVFVNHQLPQRQPALYEKIAQAAHVAHFDIIKL